MRLQTTLKKWLIWVACLLLNSSYIIYILRLAIMNENLLEVTRTHLISQSNKLYMIMMSMGVALMTLVFSDLKRNVLTITFYYFSGLTIVFIMDFFLNFITHTRYPVYILSLTSLLCICYLAFLLTKSRLR